MKVCYFGTFDKNYLRNRIIRKGLEKNNIQVVLCHTKYTNLLRVYLELFFRWIKLSKKDIKAIIVGETGYILMPLAWFIAKLWKKKLILDAFFSLYDTYVCDRRIVKENSFTAKKFFLIDKIGCLFADLVLLDTNAHIEYFKKIFSLPKKLFLKVAVGTDEDVFYPKNIEKKENKFIVLFWGTFIPLHGIENIVKSAKLLEEYQDILFQIVGRGQTYTQIINLAEELKVKNVEFLDFVNEEKLAEKIAEADVCLGIFGSTDKAKRVIPHKVYQAIAMKKPVITADTTAIREMFENEENILLSEISNPESLAEKILKLKKDSCLREKIAENGYKLFLENFTSDKIVKELIEYVSY